MGETEKQPEQPKAVQQKMVIGESIIRARAIISARAAFSPRPIYAAAAERSSPTAARRPSLPSPRVPTPVMASTAALHGGPRSHVARRPRKSRGGSSGASRARDDAAALGLHFPSADALFLVVGRDSFAVPRFLDGDVLSSGHRFSCRTARSDAVRRVASHRIT